jgi:hypothetical protein
VRFEASANSFTHLVLLGYPTFSGISSRTPGKMQGFGQLRAMSILDANCSLEPSLRSNSVIERVGGIAQRLAHGIACFSVSQFRLEPVFIPLSLCTLDRC